MTLVALTTALTELDGMLYHVIIVFCALDRRCIPKPHKTAGQLQNFAKLERNLFWLTENELVSGHPQCGTFPKSTVTIKTRLYSNLPLLSAKKADGPPAER